MNSSNHSQLLDRTGSALLAVMGIVFLIAIVAASTVTTGRQQIFAAAHLRDYVKAQMIAEAGANQAYNLMKTNFAARLDPNNFPATSFDGGTYDAAVISVASNTASISCTGLFGTATAMVKVDIRNIPTLTTNGAPVQGVGPYGFAILAGGDLGWAGNSDMQMSNGWMHCNGTYSANGINIARANVSSCMGISLVGNATITGIGKAPSISGSNIGQPIVTNVPTVTIPNIDLTPYYNTALSNNQVFASGKSLSGTVTPNGGVMWVNGSMSFGNGTYNGCFIATGAIELKTTGNGNIALNKVNRYPVLASRDGTITVKQAKTLYLNGLIYCKTGSFDKQGNGDVLGSGAIIAAGNVSKNGGWSGMLYSDPTPVPPGGSLAASTDKVIITAWQD
jgi:hypothetical protein